LSFKDDCGEAGFFLPKMATAFGGGIARKGLVCGALTGAVMVIGMAFGRTDPRDKESLSRVYDRSRQLLESFEKEFGSPCCYTLTGYHLDDPAEHEKWSAAGGKKRCGEIIRKTAAMLSEVLKR
jgi:C_GCAxxG_C_C family probable redox protein